VAEQALELRLLKKKHDRGWGKRGMRYPASEKLEIIPLVEQSHLPVRRTLEKLGSWQFAPRTIDVVTSAQPQPTPKDGHCVRHRSRRDSAGYPKASSIRSIGSPRRPGPAIDGVLRRELSRARQLYRSTSAWSCCADRSQISWEIRHGRFDMPRLPAPAGSRGASTGVPAIGTLIVASPVSLFKGPLLRCGLDPANISVTGHEGAGHDRGADYPGAAAPGGRGGAVPRGEDWREGACYSLTPW
jgi:hypothetical protein